MSSLKCGIVGLPNVGKSTLFNALTKQSAKAQNVPFTTIEPNVGIVAVPDERLEVLAKISNSAKSVPTTIEFVDIAGLVKGAHKGEGLGNKFLSNIREVDAIVHAVRFFNDENITHTEGQPDPKRDVEIIETELALADLNQVTKMLEKAGKDAKGNDPEARERAKLLQKVHDHLAEGAQARELNVEEEEQDLFKSLFLLTAKPVLYVANISEEMIGKPFDSSALSGLSQGKEESALALSVKIEQELVELPEDERTELMTAYDMSETGLNKLIKASYELLHLITFLTTGEDESRAWTVEAGAKAPEAAGKIHTDMERGFIRAETVAYDDFVAGSGYSGARSAGKVRDEGKEYVVQDGDIMNFKFSQ